ncbi:hypothetical protein [Rhizobium oryzicola]|uniref:Uncharacterized protein n=1 Tax=Rhizobium oryzicola TaxID=1232668 RepID=A0ABT8SSZ5_9HYPH|nr:hypothetical protein [Rhizobium oryzicola]MDO1581544.1 hypothetical protein [Rhizobium oryzicola]
MLERCERATVLLISPRVGEMSGRTEGGNKGPPLRPAFGHLLPRVGEGSSIIHHTGHAMIDPIDTIDLSLFGGWDADPRAPLPALPEKTAHAADAVLLELKSAEQAASGEELRQLLSEMTRELRAQFAFFRELRANAEQLAALEGDEAAQKLARADVKAATDAMSLIVRTLEKVDSLQRQLARDREAEAERRAEEGGYQEAVNSVKALIEARARELFEDWQRASRADPLEPGGSAGVAPSAPDTG